MSPMPEPTHGPMSGGEAAVHPGPQTAGRQAARTSELVRRNGVFIALLVVLVGATLASPAFLDASNILNVLRAVAIVGVMAVGQTFVAIVGGMADLSAGAVVGLSAVVTLGLQSALGPVGATVVGLSVGVTVGLVNGMLVGRFRTNAIVTTIGAGVVVNGLALWYTAGNTMFGGDDAFHAIGTGSTLGIPNIVVAFLIVASAAQLVLSLTAFGRRVYSTGGNYEAARASGIRVRRVVLLAFAISGLTGATAGIMLAALLDQVNYDSGAGFTFSSVAAVAVGGTSLFGGEGSVVRTIVGVVIIGILNNIVVLVGLPLNAQIVVTGAIILVAVAVDSLTRRRVRG